MNAEFGSSIPIHSLGPGRVTAYDADGKEIEIPICEKCGELKNAIIGKEFYKWRCLRCVWRKKDGTVA